MSRDPAKALKESARVVSVDLNETLMAMQDAVYEFAEEPDRRLREADAAADVIRARGMPELAAAQRVLHQWLAAIATGLDAADRLFRAQLPFEQISYDVISDLQGLLRALWTGMPTYVFDDLSLFKTCFPSTATVVDERFSSYRTTFTALMKVVGPYHDFVELSHRKPHWPSQLEAMDAIERLAGQSDVIRTAFRTFYACTEPLVAELRVYVADHLES